MLTTRAASSTSRRTMTAVASTARSGLFRYEAAFGRFLVELTDESIGARLKRSDSQIRCASAGYDLFELEVVTLEFFSGRIEDFHDQLEALASRNLKLRRLEVVVLDGELIGEILAIARYPKRQSQNLYEAYANHGLRHTLPLRRSAA